MDFLNHFWQWTLNNQVLWGVVSVILLQIITLIAVPAKVVKLGFNLSQFFRKFGGKKWELKYEEFLDELEKGAHSDDAGETGQLTKLLIIGTILLTSAIWSSASAENPFSHFLKARTPAEFQKPKVWEIKASAILPAAKLTISRAADRVLDVEYLSNAGAGLTYQAVILKDEKPFALYGVSAVVLKDLTAGLLFNFWNNTFGIGPGFTFGQLADRDKRPCIMFTMNYTFFQ